MTRLYPGQNIPAWEKTCVRCLAKEERRKKKGQAAGAGVELWRGLRRASLTPIYPPGSRLWGRPLLVGIT